MTNQYEFNIPLITSPEPMALSVAVGAVLYIVGANGTGKSSLVLRLYRDCKIKSKVKWIAAHRQMWFDPHSQGLTSEGREEHERQTQSWDMQPNARHQLWGPSMRVFAAMYDLIDADHMQERKIAHLARKGDQSALDKEIQISPPLEVINELMRQSNIPIVFTVEKNQKIKASREGGSLYHVSQLSDGERSALLIAAEVLTAESGTLIIIDEPERHLHRSIASPLLKLLFEHRKDCAFIVSTHELTLPLDTPNASTLLVRSCAYEGQTASSWDVDMLKASEVIDDDLKKDILGARNKIVFVEGEKEKSLDTPLYGLLFPNVSIIAK
jgi:ABC-type lipoprotein export system ATPase subunit